MADDLVLCGTYTEPSRQAGFEVTPDNPVMGMTGETGSEGIYVFRREVETGALTLLATASAVNPSFFASDGTGRFIYAVNEVRDFQGEASGAVTAFALDRVGGTLREINQIASGGGNPCHLSLSHDERFLFVANHEAGTVSVISVGDDGTLSDLVDVRSDEPMDDRGAHAHFVTADPGGAFVLSADTGTDRVMIYRQDLETGRLTPNDPPWGETHPGGSPRHLAFSSSGLHLFANGEADLTLSLFRYDPVRGALEHLQHLPTVSGSIGTEQQSTAQMRVHPNGRYVYVANRGTDTIATFRFDESVERIEICGLESTRGLTPRNFEIDPSGRWLYVANQNSNSLECFTINPTTGELTYVGRAATVPAPTCIRFA